MCYLDHTQHFTYVVMGMYPFFAPESFRDRKSKRTNDSFLNMAQYD